jgi:hypothetical protein
MRIVAAIARNPIIMIKSLFLVTTLITESCAAHIFLTKESNPIETIVAKLNPVCHLSLSCVLKGIYLS